MSKTADIDTVNVHVTNPQDIGAVKTEEHEPEFFNCYTITVQQGQGTIQGPGIQPYAQLLALDPLRKSAAILNNDQPVVLCHAQNQTTDPANQAAGVPNPQGAYLPAGGNARFTGTGPLWVVATTSTGPTRVSVIVSRRES